MLTLALLFFVAAPSPAPFSPPEALPPAADDCLTGPLQLRAVDYFTMSQVADTMNRHGCQRLIGGAERPPFFGNYVVGRTQLLRFSLFGEQLGWGINVVTRPGTRIGEPDLMYAAPALTLPESWQRAMDKATVPVIAVGGAVVLTSVVLGILGK